MSTAARGALADLALLAVAVVWGTTFPLAKRILEVLPPFWYLAVRFAVASSVLLPLSWRQLAHAPREDWARSVGVGLALTAGYALQTLGLQGSGATDAAFLTGLFVVLVPLLGALWGRRPSPWEWGGILAGTAGLALLTGGPAGLGGPELLLVACAGSFAVHILLLDAVAPRLPAGSLGSVQMLVAAAGSAAFAAAEPVPANVPGEVWFAVVGMGVLASAAAFTVQSWAQRFTSPTHVGLVFTAEPVSAALLARWWLGESLSPSQWTGAGLILIGIVLAQLRAGPAGTAVEGAAGR